MCLQHLTDSWVTLVVNKFCIISPWVSGFRDRHCLYHSVVPFGAFTCHFFTPFSKHMHLYILLLLPTPLEFKINVRMAHLLFCTMVCICLRFLTCHFLEIVHEELILFSLCILGCTRLRCCVRAYSSWHCTGSSLLWFLVAGHRLNSCGPRASLLHSMWDLPRPWLEPESSALAGGFLSTEPPGKSQELILYCGCLVFCCSGITYFNHSSILLKQITPHWINLYKSHFSLHLIILLSRIIQWQFSSVQLLSQVRLLATPWTAARQASLSITNSWSLPKLISIDWVSDTIQPSHPLLSPSPPAFNLSQHQGLFQWVSSLHQVAEVLEFQLQHQSFQWRLRTDLL